MGEYFCTFMRVPQEQWNRGLRAALIHPNIYATTITETFYCNILLATPMELVFPDFIMFTLSYITSRVTRGVEPTTRLINYFDLKHTSSEKWDYSVLFTHLAVLSKFEFSLLSEAHPSPTASWFYLFSFSFAQQFSVAYFHFIFDTPKIYFPLLCFLQYR